MYKNYLMPLVLVVLSISLISSTSMAQADDHGDAISTIKVQGDFDEIRSDVESAILNQSFVIDFNAKIGEMLNRTAPDLGINNPVYTRAESWQFCSAKLTHEMVLADPLNIAFCPYVIFAYQTVQAPGEVTVGYRKLGMDGSTATNDALNVIDKKLQDILDEISG